MKVYYKTPDGILHIGGDGSVVPEGATELTADEYTDAVSQVNEMVADAMAADSAARVAAAQDSADALYAALVIPLGPVAATALVLATYPNWDH